MKTINQFDRTNLQFIREDIQTALNEVAKKYGMTSLQLKAISFSASSFTSKIEAKLMNSQNALQVDPIFRANQERALRILGLPIDSIGRQFVGAGGMRFQVERIDLKKRKMPVIAWLVDNQGNVTTKSYKFPVDMAKRALEKAGA